MGVLFSVERRVNSLTGGQTVLIDFSISAEDFFALSILQRGRA
jgi:hypothetical protein